MPKTQLSHKNVYENANRSICAPWELILTPEGSVKKVLALRVVQDVDQKKKTKYNNNNIVTRL